MSTVAEIELAIEKLTSSQLSELSQWFEEFVAKAWDDKMEADAKAGKFDRMIEEVKRAKAAGELIDFP